VQIALGTFTEATSRRATEQLQELGVEVYTGSLVTGVEPGRIKVGDTWVATDVSLWASGVAASPLGKELGVETDRAGRVLIAQDLSVPGHREVFVIGDMAALTDGNGTRVPGLAAAAMQQGKAAAANILRDVHGNPRLPFTYKDRGNMATIGHHRAVAEFGNKKFSGVLAWLLWSVIHVLLLIGFRNRLTVLRQWIWVYLTRVGSSPLITDYRSTEAVRNEWSNHRATHPH
jgi:NADH:ubiquinone reductase (H+-translocating)